ncbi:pleckstrin homology domain-containing family H member 2-like isoform X2 [Symsagittifera roscoffensis]|uniref:pleckstrin homology domain-containing family H member 2-like isoform X2 n=1 Tax=Symsagittifera roscoffensis TaxID=84072 RepID=UPI00307B8FA6
MFGATPGSSDYSPRGTGAASSSSSLTTALNSHGPGARSQMSPNDLSGVSRHGSMSSADGKRTTECENCVHLQNQMLRFKEQVVVIRGNLGNRMAGLENQLKEAVDKERLANEKLMKAEEENRFLKKQRTDTEKSSFEMKQEIKQLYEMQLSENKRHIESLEAKLQHAETQLESFKLGVRLSLDETPSTTRKPTTTSSNTSSEVLNMPLSLTDEPDLAPTIPERPASTWRSSVLQTTSTPNANQGPKFINGSNVSAVHEDASNRLSNDDYDIVHDDERDVFFDTRQSITLNPDDVPSTQSGVPPPERPVHKYPKWEEQVYNSIKNSGFVLNQPSHDLGMLPVDKNPLKFPQGMSTVCNEIEKSFEDKTQVVPQMYASVAGVAFQLSDYPSDTWARLSLYAVDPHSASSDGITVAKEKDSIRDEEAGPGDGRVDSPSKQQSSSAATSSLAGFRLVGDDWNSAQADYCIPPDAIPEDIENRDYIKESDLDLILSKSSTMNSLDNQLTSVANAELLTGYLQVVTEEMSKSSYASMVSQDLPKSVLTRSSLSVLGANNKSICLGLENIKSVGVIPQGNGRLFKVTFHDDYSAVLCSENSKSCEQWVCEVNKALLQKPLKGQHISMDAPVIMKSWLCHIRNGRKIDVWAILSDNQLHLYASQKDKRPSESINLIGASLFECVVNENQISETGDHSLLTSDNRFSGRSSSGAGSVTCTKDLDGFMLVIIAQKANPVFIVSKTQDELIEWKYQCELCSGGGIPSSGSVFEQAISQLMRNPSESQLWSSPPFAYEHGFREERFEPLTSLKAPSEIDNAEKMWKLFLRCLKWKYDTRNNMQAAASDGYFVSQVQTAFRTCLPEPNLHNEACCQLVRLCNTKDFPTYSVTAFQLLSLFVVLTQPKTAYLWLLKQFLSRVASNKTVEGKYALYCLRMLSRPKNINQAKRRYPPSSLEVQSITQHNPHDVTQPMAVPVNLPDGATHYAGCDGTMTVDQFLYQLCLSLDIREPAISGYALYVSSPLSITPHHAAQQAPNNYVEYRLAPHLIVSDVISRYEMIAKSHLASQGMTPTPTDFLMRFHLKNRFSWRLLQQGETDRERIFSVYNYASQVSNSLVPVSRDLANYLTGLMTFIELGEFNVHVSKHTLGIKISEIIRQYYPRAYLQSLDSPALNLLSVTIQNYWSEVTNARAQAHDCIRTYLTAVRSWKFHDCKFIPLTRSKEKDLAILSVGESGIALLKIVSFEVIFFFSISALLSFGSRKNKLYLSFNSEGNTRRFELLGTYAQVFEASSSIAEYVNELNWLRRHVIEYTRSSDLSSSGAGNNANSANDSNGNIGKHDSLMVLRC